MKPYYLLLPAALGLAQPAAAQLTISSGQLTVGSGAVLYVPGALDNQAGATLANAGTVQVGGDFTNAGTLTSSGLLRLSGTQNQALLPGVAATVAQLEIANTGPAGQNTVALSQDLSVTQQLTLVGGLLRTAPAAVLTLPDGAALTGEATGRYVQGNLRAVRTTVGGAAAVAFPNSLTLNPGGNALGTVTVTRTAGLLAAGSSFAQVGSAQGIDRIWRVEATGAAPATPVTVTAAWLPDNDNGNGSFAQTRLWRAAAPAGPWAGLAAPADASSRSLSSPTADLGYFTASNAQNPLPVELLAFTAERAGANSALLRWATASEKNNDRFEVEASPDGQLFQRIATVRGQGTSTQRHDYTHPDPDLARYASPLVYYRLRQVDADGTARYSPVRSVRTDELLGLAIAALPNPVGAAGTRLLVRTATAGPLRLTAYDAAGRLVLSRTVDLPAGSTFLPLPEAGPLSTGVYYLSVSQAGQHAGLKLVHE